jgi:hypothetical protein
VTPPSRAAINAKDVAGVWLFDEGKGETAADASGNGNKGVLLGNAKWVDGKVGGAVSFDGTNASYVQVQSSDSLNMTNETSVVFWVKTTKKMVDMWADRQAVVGKHYLEYEVGIYMNAQIHTYTSNGAGDYDEGIMTSFNGKHPDGDADWLKDKWYHVAWTLKGQHEIAYVNGIKLGEFDKAHVGTKPGAHPVEIGRRVGGGIPVLGAVDEVGIFKVALDEKDIKVIFDRGLGVALGISAVDPKAKLATTWASVKTR